MKRMGIAVALALAFALSACGGSDEPKKQAAPKTFEAAGTVTLNQFGGDTGGSCAGFDGYEDIAEGAQVVIRDSKGEQVGLGRLGPGRPEDVGACVFRFSVPDIAEGSKLYAVEVANRGEVTFKRDDARQIALTLG